MKNMFKVALFAASLFAAGSVHAQKRDTTVGQKVGKAAKNVGHATATGAKAVGHATATGAKDVGKATATGAKAVGKKTSEVAAKGAAAVVDKKYDGMVSPGGETVYINDKSQYYYVNKKGHRVYLKKSQLVAKP